MPRLTVAAALITLAAFPAVSAAGAAEQAEARQIAAVVDPLIRADMAASGIPGAAFCYVHDGRIVYQQGYGFADVASRAAVDPETTVWPIASITKVITAIAALQLVDRQRVDLDADLNRYLKRVRVPAQGYPPLTLRHLLAHTGALDELPGRQFDGRTAPDLAAFLEGKLLRYRAPGLLTAYSTYGIALAGVLVEDVSGETYADYVVQRVLRPAGMSHGRVMTRLGDEKGVATAYAVEDGKAQAVPYEWYVTAPASSVVASAADMGRLAIVMQADAGAADAGRLLTPQQARAMQRQHATNHPQVPGWSLGMQMDRVNGVELAEHGGDIAGFSALFALLPDKRSGFFVVHHGEGGDLRFRVKQALLDALYPQTSAAVPVPDPSKAPALAEYAGRYISSIACRSCEGSAEDAFQVEANAGGTLTLWGQTWLPLGGDLFVRDDGKRTLGFSRNAQGGVISVTGGSWRVADRLP